MRKAVGIEPAGLLHEAEAVRQLIPAPGPDEISSLHPLLGLDPVPSLGTGAISVPVVR